MDAEYEPGRVLALGDLRGLERETSERPWFRIRFAETSGLPEGQRFAFIETHHRGREAELLSAVSALLGEAIASRRAVADFDYVLAYAGLRDAAARALHRIGGALAETGQKLENVARKSGFQAAPGSSDDWMAFSVEAHDWVAAHAVMSCRLPRGTTVGVVDSGVTASAVRTGRSVEVSDVSSGWPQPLGRDSWTDPVGHGSRVVRILDQVLCESVDFRVVGLGDRANVNVSAVVMAIQSLIGGPRTPQIFNLSLVPRAESSGAHQSRLLGFLFASARLIGVMAAGNRPVAFTVPDEEKGLFHAVALDSLGVPTDYTARPSRRGIGAFGGDRRAPFFRRAGSDASGTSWAAPLATAYLLEDAVVGRLNDARRAHDPTTHPADSIERMLEVEQANYSGNCLVPHFYWSLIARRLHR